MDKLITPREAAELIPDGATVGLAGMGLAGWPEEIACAIRDLFHETGHPRALNLKQGSAMGDWKERGVTRLGEMGEGLVAKWSGAHIGSAFSLCRLAVENKLQCHCLPQGVIVNLWREIGGGRPGLITKVGLGTFVDPREEGGRMNACTTENAADLITLDGEEYLYYKSFPLDVAILRGTTADEKGNISFEHESIWNEGLAVANAAKRSGGIVIVQVEYLAEGGSLSPKDVRIPGILVDYVVQARDKDACWQTEGVYYEPSFSGQIKKPLSTLPPMALDERKVIARRCAIEIRKGNVVNLGVGMAADVARVMAEEGCDRLVTMTTESGMIGGVPAGLPNFGSSYNPEAIMEHGTMFDFIDGGGLDVTCLGMGQADRRGNINVSKFGSRLTGPGGFINISQATPKVIFCGTFTGKAELKIQEGRLVIQEEGKIRKFLETVEQITFAGQYARPDQEILYITERCVFRLMQGELTLVEIAPGVEVERDILPHMEFMPVIEKPLKLMDEGIFKEKWGGLRGAMEEAQ